MAGDPARLLVSIARRLQIQTYSGYGGLARSEVRAGATSSTIFPETLCHRCSQGSDCAMSIMDRSGIPREMLEAEAEADIPCEMLPVEAHICKQAGLTNVNKASSLDVHTSSTWENLKEKIGVKEATAS